MALIPMPSAVLDDSDVAGALGRAVAVINPLLDVLSRADPLGLRGRSWHPGGADGSVDKVLDALARLLNTADVPGTPAWADKDLDGRINWWVRRVGALDTVLVAAPGVFGAVADRLPVQDVLAFANQAIVLCAVAREYGVDDRSEQVRLLGAVMCHRDLCNDAAKVDVVTIDEPPSASDAMPVALVKGLWRLAGVMRALGDELVKRPRPRCAYRYLGMLPAVGAVADYFGEYGALVRAAKLGRKWIEQQSAVAS
ncbi:hypothetical protein [Mycolicibacterium sp. 050158]|jgi:hypothetical protein|uniref:hypothetical protein n=1 Tax=Mycolicibacterium sp. 050158 TaxID=3090602 RepID=UPI00299D4318|nr:hypothetical protein [Mycolicibacterium sp. 050158]MDX1891542.1 hypothetical protein [Mycolicibacterium sp. 050158]